MAAKKHAELSGSTAHRWIPCPGSYRLTKGFSRPSSGAAREGTKAHAFAEHALRGNELEVGTTITFDDHGESVTAELENDMLEHVMVYVDHVLEHAAEGVLHVEKHISLERLVRAGMYGTADAVVDKKKLLVVSDFKYGFVPVHLIEPDSLPAKYNPQLMYYAAGALDAFDWRHKRVLLEIVQPRCMEVESIQSVELSAEYVRQWATETLWAASHAVDNPNAPLVPGEWCRFCEALADCPAAMRSAQELAMTDFAQLAKAEVVGDVPAAIELTPEVPDDRERLSQILKCAPIVDAWLRACEERAHELLERGEKVPGFKLVAKRSRRVWPGVTYRDIALQLRDNGLPIERVSDILHEPEIMSPSQLEKKFGKRKAIVNAINSVAIKPDTGTTVAFESDERPAITPGGDFEELL